MENKESFKKFLSPLTVKKASEILGVSAGFLLQEIEKGKLRALSFGSGNQYRILQSDLDEFAKTINREEISLPEPSEQKEKSSHHNPKHTRAVNKFLHSRVDSFVDHIFEPIPQLYLEELE